MELKDESNAGKAHFRTCGSSVIGIISRVELLAAVARVLGSKREEDAVEAA